MKTNSINYEANTERNYNIQIYTKYVYNIK